MRRPGSPPAHQPIVEAEEINSLTAFDQMHDTGLGCLRRQPELTQQVPQPRQRGLGLLPRPTHHHQVIAVAHQHTVFPGVPLPVQPVQVHVA